MYALNGAGIVTGAAVVQVQGHCYAASVTLSDIRQQIRQTENALRVLLSQVFGAIARGTLAAHQSVATLQTGVPAQLLHRRPEVQQAQ